MYSIFSKTQINFSKICLILLIASVAIQNSSYIRAEENTNTLINDTDTSISDTDTVIETGDAESHADVHNITNTNITETKDDESETEHDQNSEEEFVETDLENTEEASEEGNADTEELESNSETDEQTSKESEDEDTLNDPNEEIILELDIDNENEAEITNIAEVIAETGENTAQGANVLINTGNALAYANIVNLANTNIFDSNGFLVFFNQLFGNSSLDLRDLFEVFHGGDYSYDCSLDSCGGDTILNIKNENTANISNSVIVRSSTGQNSASSTSNALINTGDAYASSNVLNVANTNITNANYLLVSFNNIGDLTGDIVLPGKNFFEKLFKLANNGENTSQNIGGNNINVENDNEVIIENNIDVSSSTGGNEVMGDNSQITTGNAVSSTQIYNQVNTNIIGTDSFLMLFRINGNWVGDIFGKPNGLLWQETSDGIEIYNDQNNNSDSNLNNSVSKNINVKNDNLASIQNNIEVYALTGDNKIESENNASINTGNAFSASNVTNIVNTNILGRNWVVLIFNILGNFTGNIAFGMPDLWLGTNVMTYGTPGRGSTVTYKFTVSNLGDADATNVRLKNHFDRGLLFFDKFDELEEGFIYWNLGDILAGETKEFAFDAVVSEELSTGETAITTSASVESLEKDNNNEDNTDIVTITVLNPEVKTYHSSNNGQFGNYNDNINNDVELYLSKTADLEIVNTPTTVKYTINIVNNGNSIYDAELVDTLKDSNGVVVNEDIWDLGEIYPNEEIEVTYDTVFNEESLSGIYTNIAQIFAFDSLGNEIESNLASFSIEVAYGEVLGQAICEQNLLSFMKFGDKNNSYSEVIKLQNFLREHENYEIEITGEFDDPTNQAVKLFQDRYREDILEPWGITAPTGYVYLTTQKKMNDIYCGGNTIFPLTYEQQNEILSYKARQQSLAILPKKSPVVYSQVKLEKYNLKDLFIENQKIQVKNISQTKQSKSLIQSLLGNVVSSIYWIISGK